MLTTLKVVSVIKKSAQEEYLNCKHGVYESINDYK